MEYEIVEEIQQQTHGKEPQEIDKRQEVDVRISLPRKLTSQTESTCGRSSGRNEVVAVPVKLRNLAWHIDNLKTIPDGFLKEYKLIPNGQLGTLKAAKRPESEGKDRFHDISAYDHSRVVLKKREPNQDYINASFIKGIRESRRLKKESGEVDKDHLYLSIYPTADQNIDDYYNMRPLTQTENENRGDSMSAVDEDPLYASIDSTVDRNINEYYNTTQLTQADKTQRTIHGIESFIASQGPVSGTMRDFLQMVWQEDVNRIVMVTELSEDGKVNCERYWPEHGALIVEEFKIMLLKEDTFDDFIIRDLSLRWGDESRTVRQFNYIAWPEGCLPDSATSLIDFRRKVRSFDDCATGPMLVHCSTGVGRTGTFIALDCLMDQASKEGSVDVLRWTKMMRRQRMKMIETLDQYVFLYDALLESNIATNTTFGCADMKSAVARLQKQVKMGGKTGMVEQFEIIVALRPLEVETTDLAGRKPENHSKNRSSDIIPRDDRRPLLMTPVDCTSDYINAVYVDGYKRRNAYLLTQMTLENTICDIWRLILDHKVRSLVVLNQPKLTEKPEEIYWPVNVKDMKKFGPLTVQLVRSDIRANYTLRELKLKLGKATSQHLVRQYVIDCADELPPTGNMLEVIEKVGRWQQKTGRRPITIQCLDGVSLSGVYCAASYILEKMKVDREVDIFHTVKQMRAVCPHVLPNIQQYSYLHELALTHIDGKEVYANLK